MSKEEDDTRQYRCLKKYEEIVKQVLLFDELADSVDPRSRLPKRRRNSRGSSTASIESVTDQGRIDQVFVQTITRFLHELNPNVAGPDCKPSNQ